MKSIYVFLFSTRKTWYELRSAGSEIVTNAIDAIHGAINLDSTRALRQSTQRDQRHCLHFHEYLFFALFEAIGTCWVRAGERERPIAVESVMRKPLQKCVSISCEGNTPAVINLLLPHCVTSSSVGLWTSNLNQRREARSDLEENSGQQ